MNSHYFLAIPPQSKVKLCQRAWSCFEYNDLLTTLYHIERKVHYVVCVYTGTSLNVLLPCHEYIYVLFAYDVIPPMNTIDPYWLQNEFNSHWCIHSGQCRHINSWPSSTYVRCKTFQPWFRRWLIYSNSLSEPPIVICHDITQSYIYIYIYVCVCV